MQSLVPVLFARLALIAAAASVFLLSGCGAQRHYPNTDLELAATTPAKLPPPNVWVQEKDLATTGIAETSLPAAATPPQAPIAPETAVIRLYPHSANDGQPAEIAADVPSRASAGIAGTQTDTTVGGTASVPIPQTNTAEAFSADASVFNDQPGDGASDVDKAFGSAAAATAPSDATQNAAPVPAAPPTGTAVRAAAAAGARAFDGSDTANTTAPTAQRFSVSYEKRGIIIKLDDGEVFAPRQATLSSAANQHLDEVAAFLTKYPGRAVIVESHTDSAGAAPENLQLSQNRAEMIRAALLARGASPGSVTARGYGEDYPVASNVSEDGRAANRRIEIVLLPPGQNGPRYREMFEASSGDLMNNQAGEAPGTNALDLGSDRNM